MDVDYLLVIMAFTIVYLIAIGVGAALGLWRRRKK